ncbi:discoidin domain-containing protein [Streptomyces netropsis]|uniref:Putative nucleic acid-binding Zn ribbon protein n=1 Tax=Streptomyces netropsis TaxID=55404 RepID=A0A7W7L7Q9_STRNE|nr:discoidin domain-containing protein [Streptomyces netropsis]MBB4885204.1 putative nucleic acid-binding Zn ribbon protein [Streptomyces netropsis]
MTCPDCGHRNDTGDRFCASCQAFLEWEEQPAPAPPSPATAPPPPAPSPSPAPATPAPSVPPRPTVAPLAATPPRPRTPPTPAEPPSPPAAAPPPPAAPRRPGDRPERGPDGGPDPGRETGTTGHPAGARRPTGRLCPLCRTDNPYDRRLCHRCGAVLDTAPPPRRTRPPWWRRILRRSDRALAAGSRPRHRTWRRPRLALPLTLLVLLLAVWFGRSHLPDVFTFTQDRTTKPEALRPTEVRASSEAPGHPASAAFDGFNNRYWAPVNPGSGIGQYLEADFDKPVRLRELLITSGSSVNQDEFLTQARPAKITVLLVAADGERRTKTVTLRDQPGQQTFAVRGSDVVRIRLTADADFGIRLDRRLAVAEVEFFGRR